MAIHEIHVEDAPKEVMEDLRLSFAHLESFAKRSSVHCKRQPVN